MPEDEDSETANQEPSIELPTKDLEQWLDHQADQLGTPTWWVELQAVPSITDLWPICPEDTGILSHTGDPVPGMS